MIPKKLNHKRMKPKDWEQPKYIAFLKRLFPGCEIHHLVHNKRPDRRRKDDRLVWPLSPHDHDLFHGKEGNEPRFFKDAFGIDDIYKCGDHIWTLWELDGKASEADILSYVADSIWGSDSD